MARWTESEYRVARMDVEKLDRHIAVAGAPSKNPFQASQLTEFLPAQRPRLENALDMGKSDTEALKAGAMELAPCMGAWAWRLQSAGGEAEVTCRAARRAMDVPHLDGLAPRRS